MGPLDATLLAPRCSCCLAALGKGTSRFPTLRVIAAVLLAAILHPRGLIAQDADFPEFSLPRLSEPAGSSETESAPKSSPKSSQPTPRSDESRPARNPAVRDPFRPADESGSRRDRSDVRRGEESMPLSPLGPGDLDGLRNFGMESGGDSALPGRTSRNGRRSSGPGDESEDSDSTVLPPDTEGRFPVIRPRDETSKFDWSQQSVSVGDIEVGRSWPFEHGKATLNEAEIAAYVDFVRAVENKRQTPTVMPEQVNVTSLWEASFYRYAQVRRQAWQNGTVKLHVTSLNIADPFAGNSMISATDKITNIEEPKEYSLRIDMQAHPDEFIGRPIVLYGLFKPRGTRELQARRSLEGEDQVYRLQTGLLRNLQDTQTIAVIDASGYIDPQSQSAPSKAWPTSPVAIPVMVKGWFVKRWQQQPLIYTDVLRILTPRPYDKLVLEHVRSKQQVSDEESWIYYETLRQMQVTSGEVQAALALADQNLRVKELLQDAKQKVAADLLSLDNRLRRQQITRDGDEKTEGYEASRKRLERQFDLRVRRADQHLKSPATFPMFVDLFDDPERWTGRLITLRGHVRRVTTCNGDSTLFDGQPLHELWLYTDDSHHNPAVIVTPSLPRDFPVSSDLVDSVKVTGCFFKMYRYRGQKGIRPAPLVLAGHVEWNPTPEHVINLAKDGHIRADATILAVARSNERRVSDTTILVIGFLSLIAAMTIWGRVQRDRRERKRLLSLVDETPNFRQTPQNLYARPFADSGFEPTRG